MMRVSGTGSWRWRAILLLAFSLWNSVPARGLGYQGKQAGEAPAGEAPAGQAKAIEDALDRALGSLVKRTEGHIPFGSPGHDALALYALVKGGVDLDSDAVEILTSRLALASFTGTYDRACMILALVALDKVEHRDWIFELADVLVENQNPAGDWGYPAGQDLSNTQYGALGLWAAARAGYEVPVESWENLLECLRRYAGSEGGYGYRNGSGATGSMTAAGIGVLAICRERLQAARRLTPEAERKSEARLAKSLHWLDRHFEVTNNPGGGTHWLHYYLYGLERVGGLAGVKRIGGHDWYKEGARFLVRSQKANGTWGQGQGQTAFGILFLRRATHTLTGKGSGAKSSGKVARGNGAAFTLVASGDTPLDLWITTWKEAMLPGLIWPGEQGKGPRILRVEYRSGGQVIASVPGSRLEPAGDKRFAQRHVFREPGAYTLTARVFVQGPRRKDEAGRPLAGELRTFESAPLEVRIEDVIPDWLAAQIEEGADYILEPGRVQAKASSSYGGGEALVQRIFHAGLAVDGKLRTPWLAAPSDERPTLSLKLSPARIADTLVVFAARSTPHRVGYFSRPLELEVSINGGKPERMRMHVDERHAGRLEWPKPIKIRRIEIVIPWSAPGEKVKAVGLAEVQLLRRRGGKKGSKD
ncbi:MAG: hypothetical protein ACI8QC_002627 [Planctomycetota bacterium]|jgi:hypothetical protein